MPCLRAEKDPVEAPHDHRASGAARAARFAMREYEGCPLCYTLGNPMPRTRGERCEGNEPIARAARHKAAHAKPTRAQIDSHASPLSLKYFE